MLYTCLATRGIVLDVTHNASIRRGCPNNMASDNGSSFIAGETQSFSSAREIAWEFNLQCAPWWGGIWERPVELVKTCMKKSIGTKRLTYNELRTFVSEIEVILNNRPICEPHGDDPEITLPPNHLIFGRKLESSVSYYQNIESAAAETTKSLNRRQQHLQKTLEHFTKRWKREHLTAIRERHMNGAEKHAGVLSVEVVIIHDDMRPRHLWKLGRIEELVKGEDGVVPERGGNSVGSWERRPRKILKQT